MTTTETPKSWIVTVGSDDPNATVHTDIDEAEQVAKARSQTVWTRSAMIRRSMGETIRRYEDGLLVGYLNGSGYWVDRTI